MDFSPKYYWLFVCNPVRIDQNIQNEVLVERSIFADIVAHQLISLN